MVQMLFYVGPIQMNIGISDMVGSHNIVLPAELSEVVKTILKMEGHVGRRRNDKN